MSVQVKHLTVATQLLHDIRSGSLAPGDRLAGEHALAHRFAVSRGTIRQALAHLERDGLIEKHAGAGSFVTYDGARLDAGLGWSQALAVCGVPTLTEVMRLRLTTSRRLAERMGLEDATFLAIDRRRRLPEGAVVSVQRSRLPWRAELEGLDQDELEGASLTATLAQRDLSPATWHERVEVAFVSGADAAALEVVDGAAYLSCARTTYLADGAPLECVTSLLDPAHFRLELNSQSL